MIPDVARCLRNLQLAGTLERSGSRWSCSGQVSPPFIVLDKANKGLPFTEVAGDALCHLCPDPSDNMHMLPESCWLTSYRAAALERLKAAAELIQRIRQLARAENLDYLENIDYLPKPSGQLPLVETCLL